MNNNITDLVYILDMSGSMHDLAKDTIGGYNALLNAQRKLSQENPALKANVTTVLFDDRYILLHERADINTVPDITEKEYAPMGTTAMLDAIGRTLIREEMEITLLPEEERPGLVSVTILTDGEENASKEFSWGGIHAMIKKRREYDGWVFSFIGANIDVAEASAALGIDKKMAKKYTASKKGTASVFASITRGTSAMRCMAAEPAEDREDALAKALKDIK